MIGKRSVRSGFGKVGAKASPNADAARISTPHRALFPVVFRFDAPCNPAGPVGRDTAPLSFAEPSLLRRQSIEGAVRQRHLAVSS